MNKSSKRKVKDIMKKLQKNHEKDTIDNVSNYYIDFIPKKDNQFSYLEVKDFFVSHYLELYEDKMIRILLKLLICFNLKVYLTDFPIDLKSSLSKEYANLVGTDLTSLPIEKWTNVIKYILKEELSSVQILSFQPRFLISINSGFANELRRIPNSHVDLVRSIVESEGLYLIKMEKQDETINRFTCLK